MRKKVFDEGIIGIEEFTTIQTLMHSVHADRIRAGMLSLLDRGRLP